MKLPPRQIVAKQRISKITEGVYEAINKVCKEDGFEVTYAEINSALIKVLQDNNQHELKELYNNK
jgi:hypothetical protein